MTIWAAEWCSKDKIDGERKHIINENCLPKLFKTRREARLFIKEKYGFIATRPDLRSEPHGWRMPRVIKVDVIPQEGGVG